MSTANLFGMEPTLPIQQFATYISATEPDEAGNLSSTQSGSYVLVVNTGSAYTINLPHPTTNTNCQFTFVVASSLSSGAVTISAGAAYIWGSILSSDGTAVTGGDITGGVTNVILGTTAVVGDRYTFFSDAFHWYLQGTTALHTSVTVS